MNVNKRKTCAIYTLGCKVNQYETEIMLQDLERRGLNFVTFSDKADVYIINTCTVTSLSDHKSRQMIRRALRQNPKAFVAVTGCYAESAPVEIRSIPGVKLVLGNEEKSRLSEMILEKAKLPFPKTLKETSPRQKLRTRALIKIQDGCDQYCSFCIVPYVRGKPTSRPLNKIVDEVSWLAGNGTKEVVLTGIHLGKYGIDLPRTTESHGRKCVDEWSEGTRREMPQSHRRESVVRGLPGRINLVNLVLALTKIPELKRIRLSSLEVREVTDELVSLITSSPKICCHLHIPLQSGSNKILKLMNRNYTREEYLEIIKNIKKNTPEISLTTDIMVGFPSETEEQFNETQQMAEAIGFSKLHVFKFSPRKGTAAATLEGQVSEEIKKRCSEAMLELGDELRQRFLRKHLGKEVEVLVEEKCKMQNVRGERREALLTGLTDDYAKVYFKGPEEIKGQIVKVQVLELRDGGLWGKLVLSRIQDT